MEHCTKKATDDQAIPRFDDDSIEQAMRRRIRDTIEELVKEELFTFLRFPPSQWKALRTTNALERINEEFRRRTRPHGHVCRDSPW